MTKPVLYLMSCGAGPADHIDRMIKLAHADGWDAWCLATPSAVDHFSIWMRSNRVLGTWCAPATSAQDNGAAQGHGCDRGARDLQHDQQVGGRYRDT